MANAKGESREPPLRLGFDRRIKLEFHGARISSDGGLLAYRELDDVLGLTDLAASVLGDGRRGRNIRHRLPSLVRQAVLGRLAGYEDVNDAERLARDPVMRAIVARLGEGAPIQRRIKMHTQKLFLMTAPPFLVVCFAFGFAKAQPGDCCVELEAQVATLEARLTELEEKTAAMSVETVDNKAAVIFEGVNVYLRDGTGATECDDAGCNGLGNLIIGYNEAYPPSLPKRTGSHNLVVGSGHDFSSYGGMVVGYENTISGEYASVSGGHENEAKGAYASVSGGRENEAKGSYSSVSGGDENLARGLGASVLGGEENWATGTLATISGGRDNSAVGNNSSVGGGYDNVAIGSYDFVPIGAISNATYVCGSWVRIPGRTDRQATASCPTAQIAVGGGFQWQGGPATLNVFMSTRAAPNQWVVRAYSSAENGNDPADQDMVQACTVCADANP